MYIYSKVYQKLLASEVAFSNDIKLSIYKYIQNKIEICLSMK